MASAPHHEGPGTPPTANLKARTYRSAAWITLRFVVIGALQILCISMLARILEPIHFGQVSIVIVLLTLCEVFSQTGVDASLVRQRGDIGSLLHPAWSLQVIRGFAISGLLMLLAVPAAHYLKEPQLSGLILVAAVVPSIDGLRSMGPVLLGRNLAQGRLTVAETAVAVLQVPISVVLAFWLRSPWALVISCICFGMMRTTCSYMVHPYRARFTLKWSPLRAFLRYGLFYNLAGGVAYLLISIDKFLIGRMLGLHSLGLYDRCFAVCGQPVLQLPKILAGVAYPSLSSIAAEPERLHRNQKKYLKLVALLFILLPVLFFLLADPLVRLLIGAKFLETIPLFKILAIFMGFRGMTIGFSLLFDVHGQSQMRFYANLVHLGALLVALPTGIYSSGLFGAVIGITIASVVGFLCTCVLLFTPILRDRRMDPRLKEVALPSTVPSIPVGGGNQSAGS